MGRYVFISYKTEEKSYANQIRSRLTREGIPVWMAPDCIAGGENHTEEVSEAIKCCGAFILVLSQRAMQSPWISREVGTAIGAKKRILPFRIDNAPLTESFSFMLTGVQYYEAFINYDSSLNRLVTDAKRLMNISSTPQRNVQSGNAVPRQTRAGGASGNTVQPSGTGGKPPAADANASGNTFSLKGCLIVLVLAIIAVIILVELSDCVDKSKENTSLLPSEAGAIACSVRSDDPPFMI